ncbi:MAG TPA: hypothetical protein VHH35_03710 [Pyrinomonadaceae bacterium]|nr:hypothetical protein [Pyrinomonadaceae bacterium]
MSETELTIPHPLTSIEACANCNTALVGVHCHECGQKKIDPNEFSLKPFLALKPHDPFVIDKDVRRKRSHAEGSLNFSMDHLVRQSSNGQFRFY